ncbi:DUF4957 domain-containing protein [Sabulibacter ruber]|uniref:DUF4957 domain-containing protein n=1 Tax=Sabulibacter ruber TaxID=2811901 RepID=UPI001A97926A|nr:DUF4957 domain-containing protein [Sabulibacter ruber]
MRSKLFKLLYPAFALMVVSFVSCKEEEEDLAPMRMFQPGGEIAAASGETMVKLTWKTPANTPAGSVTYTVEVAKDTLFQTPVILTAQTDTTAITFTDQQLEIKQDYFARVKTNARENSAGESKWLVGSRFRIRGEQIFNAPLASEIKDKTAILRWRPTAGVTRIVLTPATGTPVEITLTPENVAANSITLSNLKASTLYTAEIFAGTMSKGITNFATKEPSIFTLTITPADDLLATVASAANGDVIGLEPGVYNAQGGNILVTGKTITLQSTSGNPSNTRVNFKEVVLEGTGAGVKLKGIEFDGTAANAAYFLNLVGSTTKNDAPATFTDILVEDCIVRNMANCFIRADRATTAADHKITSIAVKNTIAGLTSIGTTYVFFTLPKLQFETLTLENSTFYGFGRTFMAAGTEVPVKPTILITNCTIGNFGGGGANRNYLLFDGNTNPVNFTLQNSIIGNAPLTGQLIGNAAFRANGAGSSIVIRNNNMFNLTNGATPALDLTFPANATPTANKTIVLSNWTANTFEVPADSELKTASTTGGPIGDPRWVK